MESKKFKISENGILFIKKYALKTLNLKLPLTEDDFYSLVEEYAADCELNMIDDDGNDFPDDEIDERDKLGDMLITELSHHCEDEIDLDDLNRRLSK